MAHPPGNQPAPRRALDVRGASGQAGGHADQGQAGHGDADAEDLERAEPLPEQEQARGQRCPDTAVKAFAHSVNLTCHYGFQSNR